MMGQEICAAKAGPSEQSVLLRGLRGGGERQKNLKPKKAYNRVTKKDRKGVGTQTEVRTRTDDGFEDKGSESMT